MDEVWKTITTPVFLVCSLVVGLLINLVSHYLTKGLDKVFGGWNVARAKRLQDTSDQFESDVKMLCQHPNLIQFFIAEENRLKWVTAVDAIIGLLVLLTAYTLLLSTTWTRLSPFISAWLVLSTLVTLWAFKRALKNARVAYYHGQAVRAAFLLDRDRVEWSRAPGPVTNPTDAAAQT